MTEASHALSSAAATERPASCRELPSDLGEFDTVASSRAARRLRVQGQIFGRLYGHPSSVQVLSLDRCSTAARERRLSAEGARGALARGCLPGGGFARRPRDPRAKTLSPPERDHLER